MRGCFSGTPWPSVAAAASGGRAGSGWGCRTLWVSVMPLALTLEGESLKDFKPRSD